MRKGTHGPYIYKVGLVKHSLVVLHVFMI